MISTKGRYALRVMVELAENKGGTFIPLKEIAAKQNISQKYLESIMTVLSKAKIVEGAHGKGGGYRLNKNPEEYTISEILKATEGSLAPVACLDCDAEPCERAPECRTLPMWSKLNSMIDDYFTKTTIADLIKKEETLQMFQ